MTAPEQRSDLGDACLIEVGQSHALENNSDQDLVFMALIYNE